MLQLILTAILNDEDVFERSAGPGRFVPFFNLHHRSICRTFGLEL